MARPEVSRSILRFSLTSIHRRTHANTQAMKEKAALEAMAVT
jgi:hypothetical protein